ncbi:taste receptor type 2 member 8-like [Dendrobates tinctorius]|uniref:taste receptor type 2 member 8-like n=1 Tax=Dendrobates tinctorius TaxID=92724 RepID=UPI003CCA49B5
MRSPIFIVGVLVLSAEVFVSITINLYILFVVLCDWKRKKHLKSRDKIQVALNVSGTILTIVTASNLFPDILQTALFNTWYSKNIGNLFSIYYMCSSSWLTAVLCFFYFIKVVHVQQGFLIWMKMNVGSIIPWQILVGKLMSLMTCILSLFFYTPPQVLPMNNSTTHPFIHSPEETPYNSVVGVSIFALICVPFLLSFIATILTVGFLKLHIKKMKDTMTSGDINLTLYKSVVHKMARFLVLYSVFYLAMFFYHYSIFAPYSPGYWITLILIFLFNPAQAFLHIWDNPKLRSSWKEMSGCVIFKTVKIQKP